MLESAPSLLGTPAVRSRRRIRSLSGTVLCVSILLLGDAARIAAQPSLEDSTDGQLASLWRNHRRLALATSAVFLGQLTLIAGLVLNRRRRVRAETALRRNERRTSAILRAMPDLMFVLNRDGVYLDYHVRDVRELFAPPSQFLGRRVADIFPPDLAATFQRQMARAFETDEPVTMEYSLPMEDGERHYEMRLVRCDADSVITIVRDVSERHRSEAELHRAHTELARDSRIRALGELAAGITHEVSQPLAAMITNARAGLRRLQACRDCSSLVHDVLHDIVTDGKRATDVITRVRELMKQDPLRRDQVAINDVIQDVAALSGRVPRQRRLRIDLDLAPNLPVLTGDYVQLQQVLLNLVGNAADAIHARGDGRRGLAIRSARRGEWIVVSVQDSGPGLDPDAVERIFTPFFSTKRQGMGVGLAISRSIVEAHGGTLSLAANSPDGATFEVALPVR